MAGPRWKIDLVSAMVTICGLDGDLDLIVANSNPSNQVWLNDSRDQFSRIMNTPQQQGSTAVVLGDFDDAGDFDAFFGRYGTVKSCG